MKALLLFTYILCSFFMNAQKPTAPKWGSDNIQFKTVEMEMRDATTKKIIFTGYKDSYIQISNFSDNPTLNSVAVKLSGYFHIESGRVDSYEYKQTTTGVNVTYSVIEMNKFCYISIHYEFDEDVPKFIVCVSTEDYTKKPTKSMAFTLKGFE